jgi:flagellar FliL protein
VSLGTYHVVSFNPSTGTSMSIDFELFGVVLAAEEAEFAERFLLHEKRLNEQVTIAIRGMESADFTDPGLGLIKRIILEKVNRALGKTLVRECLFSEFAFIER